MNGLRTKLAALKETINACLYEVIILTETNLTSDILTSELTHGNYSVFRKDRTVETSHKASGGGVLVAIHSKHPATLINSTVNNIECVFVSALIYSQPFVLGAVYIPPQSPSRLYQDFCVAAEEAFTYCNIDTRVILTGDFNQPETSWALPLSSSLSFSSRCLVELASVIQLEQLNRVNNSHGVILDLVFSENSTSVCRALDTLIPEDDHHPALEISVNLLNGNSYAKDTFFYDTRKCNFHKVLEWLEWKTYPNQSSQDVERDFEQFCLEMSDCIRMNSPLRRTGKSKFPCWFSRQLKELVIKKKVLHKLYKTTLDDRSYEGFCAVREECKLLTKTCHENYLQGVDSSLKTNPKSFWGHMRSLSKTGTVPGKIEYEQATTTEPVQMCELFTEYFSTVYSRNLTTHPYYSYNFGTTVVVKNISAIEIERKLSLLDGSKGAGPDDITPAVLKYCKSVLAPHLSIFFNMMLRIGVFPNNLKPGYLVPIHKSGDNTNVKNYRPIVIQSAVAKLFESLVLDFLSFPFKNVLIPEQHGFRSGKSTVTNLCVFTGSVLSAFSHGQQVDCIYLDFSKAFDKVSHIHLIAKLQALGIGEPLLGWFRSYLTGRTLKVRFASALSESCINVSSGVPQGSHLGPFLFSLFINDIGESLDSRLLLFADDIKIYSEIFSTQDQIRLQDDLDKIENWCSVNNMELNVGKCLVMSFGRQRSVQQYNYRLQNTQLRRVTEVRDLGVVMTPTLDPGIHIDKICRRANSILGLIVRSSRGFSMQSLRALYIALVRPILEYASSVWAPYQIGHCRALDSVQKRFIRLVGVRSGIPYLEVNISEMERTLDVSSLSSRRDAQDLILLFKIVNSHIDCAELLEGIDFHIPRGTRHHQVFGRQHSSTAYDYNSTIPRLMRLGNSSQLEFFGVSIQSFRRAVYGLPSGLRSGFLS